MQARPGELGCERQCYVNHVNALVVSYLAALAVHTIVGS